MCHNIDFGMRIVDCGMLKQIRNLKSEIRNDLKVTIATGSHLFPFRTEKLSPPAPMVLQWRESRSSPTLNYSPGEIRGFFYELSTKNKQTAKAEHKTSTFLNRLFKCSY